MKYTPSDDEMEKIFNPAYEDIMSICDDLDIETKCGNEFSNKMWKWLHYRFS